MDKLSDDELLFFGSVMTNFAYQPGTVHFIKDYSFNELPSSSRSQALSQEKEDADLDHLVLPNMPTTDIQLQKKANCNQGKGDQSDGLSRPLIKTKDSGCLTGVTSGIRSALIKMNSSKWYRLKGCGNHTDGFPIEPVANSEGKLTIRGCAFVHTIYRELHMTDVISQILTQHHIECANSPAGWFEYESDSKLGPFRWPTIVRGCIVMETLANKRLSDHVLYGIEQLFALIANNKHAHPVDLPHLLTLFPSHRLTQSDQNGEQLVPLPTWSVALEPTLGPWGGQRSGWLDAASHFSSEIPSDVDIRWRTLWQTNIEMINQYRQINTLGDLLSLMYRRIGFECGSILGLMHYHQISWGTYTDALGTHCNAHLNNMVIKLPTETECSDRYLLAPLDFDMSFTQRSCLQSFEELITMELAGFRLALGGDSTLNSGMVAWADMSDAQWTSVRWFLRDTMLNEFDATYNEVVRTGSVKSFDTMSNEQMRSIYCLIRLALIRTMNEIS